jgi:transcriptional regulator with XRE-family HTH domain
MITLSRFCFDYIMFIDNFKENTKLIKINTMKNEDYARRIRQYRDEKHFTQELMAYRLGMKQNTYSILESGKSKIRVESLEGIAEILEIPLSKLLEDSPSKDAKPPKNVDCGGGQINEEKFTQERRLWQALDDARIETITTLKHLVEVLRRSA